MRQTTAKWSATAIYPSAQSPRGIGPVKVRQPRILDRRASDEAEPFSSKILPPYPAEDTEH
jgi:hypothetical protein